MSRWTQADVEEARANRGTTAADYKRNQAIAALERRRMHSKYRNKRTNGYASKREAKRAEELRLLQAAGKIIDLEEQVEYVLIPKQDGERACKYVADFVYEVLPEDPKAAPVKIVEDAKGYRDPVYRIKRKLMLSVHGIRIREV